MSLYQYCFGDFSVFTELTEAFTREYDQAILQAEEDGIMPDQILLDDASAIEV